MALVSLPSPIAFPGIHYHNNGAAFLGAAATLTSAGHYLAYVFVARESMVVSHVGVRAGTASGSPTLTVSIETLDASGLPNGSGFGSSSGTTGTVTTNSTVLQALGASATISAGSLFAVKIALASGTSQVLQCLNTVNLTQQTNLPYSVINTGTPTKGVLNNHTATIALGSSSTTFYQVPASFPISAAASATFNNTTAGAKRGLRFIPSMNSRAIGIKWFNSSSTGDFNAILFNDAGSELSNSSTAFAGAATGGSTNPTTVVYFDNPVTLTAGTAYRIAIEPTTTTNVNITTMTLPSTDYRSASPAGTTSQYTTFTTAGGWVDSGNEAILPMMDVILDQVDNGTGSGFVGVIGG